MAWSGGVFTRANGDTGWVDDAAALIGIEAGLHDTQDNDFKTGINATLTKDGTNTPTANLPMNTYRHTGVGAAVATTDYARFDQVISQTQNSTTTWGGTSGGAANAQTLTLTPAITAYVAGQRFRFVAGFTNTAAATLNVNGVGAVSIVLSTTGGALTSNYIEAGLTYEVLHNGTNFRLLGDPALIKRGEYSFLGSATGTANALVLTSTGPRITSTAIYQTFLFTTSLANTGATTVAIDGLTAINILTINNTALGAGQLQAGKFYQIAVTNGAALLLNPSWEWIAFSPVISQTATFTYTNNFSYYKRVESDLVVWRFSVTILTGAGTAGVPLVMTPPIAPLVANPYFADGDAVIFDTSANTIYTCVANFVGTTALRFYTGSGTAANHFGTTPNLAVGVGDQISGVITYRV
jgi:hypothetical protein